MGGNTGEFANRGGYHSRAQRLPEMRGIASHNYFKTPQWQAETATRQCNKIGIPRARGTEASHGLAKETTAD
jgi:hypothetical protein